MITLPAAKMVTNALTKCGSLSNPRSTRGPQGLLAHLTPFLGNSMRAHRYNDPNHNAGAPMMSGGQAHRHGITVPATAVYVVFSYDTPIAWVDADGTCEVPDVRYSATTTQQQNQCRAWMGAAVAGTTTHTHHRAQGYRSA